MMKQITYSFNTNWNPSKYTVASQYLVINSLRTFMFFRFLWTFSLPHVETLRSHPRKSDVPNQACKKGSEKKKNLRISNMEKEKNNPYVTWEYICELRKDWVYCYLTRWESHWWIFWSRIIIGFRPSHLWISFYNTLMRIFR